MQVYEVVLDAVAVGVAYCSEAQRLYCRSDTGGVAVGSIDGNFADLAAGRDGDLDADFGGQRRFSWETAPNRTRGLAKDGGSGTGGLLGWDGLDGRIGGRGGRLVRWGRKRD